MTNYNHVTKICVTIAKVCDKLDDMKNMITSELTAKYYVDGEEYVGDCILIAHAFAHAHYCGYDVQIAEEDKDRVTVTFGKYDEDDYAELSVQIGPEIASIAIDGRA